MKTLLKKFQVIMYHSVAENFSTQGRPSRWKALQAATLAARRKGSKTHLGGGKILMDTGRLRMSVTHSGGPFSVTRFGSMAIEFGTRLAYAAAHQFGFHGSQSVSPFVRKQKSRDTFEKGFTERFDTGDGIETIRHKRIKTSSGIAYVKAFVREMNLPARPFLVIQDEDKTEMKATLVKHFQEWDKKNRVTAK